MKTSILIALLLFTSLLSTKQSQAQCHIEDWTALKALYENTDGDNWTNNTSWESMIAGQTVPPINCDLKILYGVRLDSQGRVGILQLPSNQLSGNIPAELGNLGSLIELHLQRNQLTGNIPSQLGSLSNLSLLHLHENQLSGTIPSRLGNLENLTRLYLHTNELSGKIPAELGDLNELTYFYFSTNQLSGNIPVELGDLSNLIDLRLHDNELSGNIPAELGNLGSLIELHLQRNQLTGNIPPQLGSLSNLSLLHLHENQLSGNIPSRLGYLENLTRLYLHTNELSGKIPAELGNLKSLTILELKNNQLNGKIPPQLGKLSSLTYLNITANQLSGKIPIELGNLSNLTYLNLGHNQLSGSIPAQLGNLSNLTYLALLDNQLSGDIPAQLGMLSNLKDLYLRENALTGNIPSELGNLKSLTNLQLQNNQLSGNIPPQLGKLSSLTYLNITANQLSGNIPPELGNLRLLVELSLGNNQLIGSIPAQLGNLSNLVNLTLDSNELNGSIPHQLGNLSNLTNLNLRMNMLNGNIPPELGKLNNLGHLFLNNNQLSGNIPPEFGNLSNLTLIRLYANQLSGNIPPELGNLKLLENLSLGSNQLSGSIPAQLGNLSNLVNLDLSYNELNGSIPHQLGNLSKLKAMNFRVNMLTGNIPPELGKLKNLTHLLLNNNALIGNIPPEFGNLSNLALLRLHTNQLSGIIPPKLGNLILLEELSLGENKLSGSIPTQLGNLSNLVGLGLNNNELNGSIPHQLGNLSNLKAMNLRVNMLNGNISPELGKLNKLTQLLLNNNELSGNIPLEFGNLSNLTLLRLHTNQLGGNIPPDLGNLKLLEELSLSENHLSGSIPAQLGNLNNLTSLSLNNNQLLGCYPNSLKMFCGQFNNESISKNNNFEATWEDFCADGAEACPEILNCHIDDWTALKALYESTDGDNWTNKGGWDVMIGNLNSPPPNCNLNLFGVSLDENGRVNVLNIDSNNLRGSIPVELNTLSQLRQINVSNNQLNGVIPDLNNLTRLNVSHNFFTIQEIANGIANNSNVVQSYSPQYFGESKTYAVNENDTVILSTSYDLTVGYGIKTYGWTEDDMLLSGKVDSVLVINKIDKTQGGDYRLRVTDENLVADLEVFSEPIKVTVDDYDSEGQPVESGQLIVQFENESEREEFERDYLDGKGVIVDSCRCNQHIYLWEFDNDEDRNDALLHIDERHITSTTTLDIDGGLNNIIEGVYPNTNGLAFSAIGEDYPILGDSVNVFILDTKVSPDIIDPCFYNEDEGLTISSEHGTIGYNIINEGLNEYFNLNVTPLHAFNSTGDGTLFKVICSIYHAINHEADIINISAGYEGEKSSMLENAIELAKEKDVFIVVAAGNNAKNNDETPYYPAYFAMEHKNVISVASIDHQNRLSEYSNYGKQSVTMATIGDNLRCTLGNGIFSVLSGTSLATYYITREIAIEISKNNKRSYSQIWSSFEANRLMENEHLMDITITGKMPKIEISEVTYESCYTPSNIEITTFDSSAMLSWNSVFSDTKYIVEFKQSDEDDWIILESQTNSIELFSLNLCNSYDVRIKTVCDGLDESSFSNVVSFYTNDNVCCPAPNNVISISDGAQIERIEENYNERLTYAIEYSPYNDTFWYYTSDVSGDLSNLLSCVYYKWRLRVQCENRAWSEPTPIQYFYSSLCRSNSNEEVADLNLWSEVTPNPTNGPVNIMILNKEFVEKNVELTIQDISGSILFQKELIAEYGTNKYFLDAYSYLPGIYFVKFVAEDKIMTTKLIIQ